MIIVPGILVNNIKDFREQINSVRDKVDWVQIDVLDGKFVPNQNLSLAEISPEDLTDLSVEVHLMVENPLRYLKDCKILGVKRVVVHYEVIHDTPEILQTIKSQGLQVTVALNPGTTVSYLENIVTDLDGILLMTVTPGAQGQAFLSEVLDKIPEIKIIAPHAILGIDGGVKLDNLDAIKNYNLDYVTVGSSLWTADNPSEMLDKLKEQLN